MNNPSIAQTTNELHILKLLIKLAKECSKADQVRQVFAPSWNENINRLPDDPTGQLKKLGNSFVYTPTSGGEHEIRLKFEGSKKEFIEKAESILPELEELKAELVAAKKRDRRRNIGKEILRQLIPVFAAILSIYSYQESKKANGISQEAQRVSNSALKIEIERAFQEYLSEYILLKIEFGKLNESLRNTRIDKSTYNLRHEELKEKASALHEAMKRLVTRYEALGGEFQSIKSAYESLKPF